MAHNNLCTLRCLIAVPSHEICRQKHYSDSILYQECLVACPATVGGTVLQAGDSPCKLLTDHVVSVMQFFGPALLALCTVTTVQRPLQKERAPALLTTGIRYLSNQAVTLTGACSAQLFEHSDSVAIITFCLSLFPTISTKPGCLALSGACPFPVQRLEVIHISVVAQELMT